jgi:CheY-like chemotaxis protein
MVSSCCVKFVPSDPMPEAVFPVIAITAFGTHADRERLLHGGFKGCLLKPFTPEKLVETILSVLND